MTAPVSRRTFFGQAALAPVAAVVPPVARPARAWIIMAIHWEYNDEWSYAEGTTPRTELYYDRDQAQAACQQLCDEFFTAAYPLPIDFVPNWNDYDFARHPDFDEETVTWDELRAEGFPDPFFVQKLVVPGDQAHE